MAPEPRLNLVCRPGPIMQGGRPKAWPDLNGTAPHFYIVWDGPRNFPGFIWWLQPFYAKRDGPRASFELYGP